MLVHFGIDSAVVALIAGAAVLASISVAPQPRSDRMKARPHGLSVVHFANDHVPIRDSLLWQCPKDLPILGNLGHGAVCRLDVRVLYSDEIGPRISSVELFERHGQRRD